jgi:lysophospholipase L1-like esterase
MLVEEVLAELPDLKIYILEPFVLNEAATQEHFGYFQTETRKRAEAAKRIAERNHLTFIPLQEEFEKAAEKVSAEYWLADGVHPSLFGHELIARRLEEAFKTYLK